MTIPEGVTSIGASAFYYCYSLSSVTIPEGVTSIGQQAFSGCYSLSSVTIPEGVTSIGTSAFYNCYSLSSVTIPEGVTEIKTKAFQSCVGLGEIHLLPTTPPTLGAADAFGSLAADVVFYVPVGTLETYQTAANWSTYASHMQEETT